MNASPEQQLNQKYRQCRKLLFETQNQLTQYEQLLNKSNFLLSKQEQKQQQQQQQKQKQKQKEEPPLLMKNELMMEEGNSLNNNSNNNGNNSEIYLQSNLTSNINELSRIEKQLKQLLPALPKGKIKNDWEMKINLLDKSNEKEHSLELDNHSNTDSSDTDSDQSDQSDKQFNQLMKLSFGDSKS
jgi:hypothetical protein